MSKIKVADEHILDNGKAIIQTVVEIYYDGENIYNKIILPKVSNRELIDRYNRIKPIVNIEGIYYYLKEFDLFQLRNMSYIGNLSLDKRGIVDMNGAVVIADFPCYHHLNSIFKPSIAEVLEQFPDDALEEANAFYLYQIPKNDRDYRKQDVILEAGCFRSKVKALILKK